MLRLFIALASVVFVVGCSKGSDSNSANTGYQLNQFGQCVQSSTGQIVSSQLCYNSGGNVIQQQCHGAYMYQGQTYHCGIVHKCSGFIMTSQYGQQVRCL